MWLSRSQIRRIWACGLARATAEAVGVAPSPGIDARAGPRIDPVISPGIDPGALIAHSLVGKWHSVPLLARRYQMAP